jgi:hypothetical protein
MTRHGGSRVLQWVVLMGFVLAPLAAGAYGVWQAPAMTSMAVVTTVDGGPLLSVGAGMIGLALWSRRKETER